MGATAEIAAFAIETSSSEIPAEPINAARRAILDTIGVTLAGSIEEPARIATALAAAQSKVRECAVWGTSTLASAQLAALANGVASHVLDYDDTNDAMRGHPSVAVLPAVYAIGERVDASGADVLAAFAIGVEVACKLGLFTGQAAYDHGWHATVINGLIGATAGAARLAGLSVEQLQHAIGIAVSSTGGVRGNFGSMTKSLHIGRLAQAAIMAVELAAEGFTGNTEAIEGDFGFWAVFGRDPEYAGQSISTVLGQPYEIAEPGFNVKAYPCCASTHAAIDAALDVRERLRPDEIVGVDVAVPYTAPLILIHHQPTTPLAAKFSLEYCVAAALQDGAVTLESFTEAAVARPDLQALLRKVEYHVPPEWSQDDGVAKTGFARITVRTADGSSHHAEVDAVRGSPGRPLSDEELEAKFTSCANVVLPADASAALLAALQRLDQLGSIRELSTLLTAEPAPVAGD